MHNIKPFIPELFTDPGTLLYIGARVDAHSWLDELREAKHQITILEVWEKNIDGIANYEGVWLVQGDVREINDSYIMGQKDFDYIFWWHGPEHLEQNEIITTLENLESKTKKLIALACPYGIYPQGAHGGNPYEEHKTTLYPEFFTELGYGVKIDGELDKAGSEIVAWKRFDFSFEKYGD